MKRNFSTFTTQAQDFFLRLFVAEDSYSTRSESHYTCSHCGTFTRLHQ